MIYLAIFWLFVAVFLIAYVASRIFNWKKIKAYLEDKGILFFIISSAFIVMALLTKDPLTIAGISIPTELQWLGSLLIIGFGVWRFYLNPLKGKVYSMDREVGEIKADVTNIKSDVRLIKERLIGGKFRRVT